MNKETLWPPLPYEEWKETLDALHMKMQVVGKIKLVLSPFLNHWWNTAFYLTASGMTTGLISFKDIILEINFDFTKHSLIIQTAHNETRAISLNNCSVAEFYRELMSAIEALGISVGINTVPAEVQNPVPCDIDERSSYDKDAVNSWWTILLRSKIIFEKFRSPFSGKSSPVHFFWGSFDLAHARYSGKPAVPPNYGGNIMKYAENEGNFALGFWAGNANYPKPAFYCYIYPAPQGLDGLNIDPKEGSFNSAMGEFILDYDLVMKSDDPEEMILDFLNSTYKESAKLAGWDVKSFEALVP